MKRLLSLFFIIFSLSLVLTGCFFSPESIEFSDMQFTYDGTEKTLTSSTEIPDKYEFRYENNSAVEVGKYLSRVVLWNLHSEEVEYESFAILEILPAQYDMSGVSFDDLTVDYNGQAHELKISSPLPEGVTVKYTENSFVNAGKYDVVASFSGDEKNYLPIDDMTATLTISPIEAPVEITVNKGLLHSKSTPAFEANLAGEVVFRSGQTLTPGTNTYYCDFIPKSANYTKKENIPVSITVKATVKYYDGTSLISTEYVDYNSKSPAKEITQYEKDNTLYTFLYWKDGDGVRFDPAQKITKDTTLYAVFEKEEKLFVKLVYNDQKTETFGFYKSKLPVSLPSPTGFLGWHTNRFYSSAPHYSITSSSINGATLYALYTPSVTLGEYERTSKPSYETKTVSLSKNDLYKGSLIEVNEELTSHISERDVEKLYGNIESAGLSSSSLLLSREARIALDLLCKDYAKSDSTGKLLVYSAYSGICEDALSGHSIALKYISNSKVSEIDSIATAKKFLSEQASSYGFIKRYKSEYADSTGVGANGFEHFYRYVGIPHAVFMERHSLSLEEYLCYIKQYTSTHLYVRHGDFEYEIYYVPATSDTTKISVPKNDSYTISGNNHDGFIVTVERKAIARELDYLICIDAGHAGSDGGADGGESIINLAVAKLVKQECERQGFTVLMTRDDNYFVSLDQRCVIANEAKADIFVSIHCNSATSSSASGTEVFYYSGTKSKNLANYVYNYMVDFVPTVERGVKYGNHQVTRETDMPAILCELAFLSNADDYAKLHDEECQKNWAEAICRGICKYYGIDYIE